MTHPAPTDCPACAGRLVVTRLTCPDCATEVTGMFSCDHDTTAQTTVAPTPADATAVRDQILAQVAAGELAPEVAADLLQRLSR